jgi:hypothetical protein
MNRFTQTLAGLALAAAAAPALAITFGQPDGNAHPYVGTILFERPDGYYSCTGTMLSPTVMLTAGHCTEEFGVANSRSWVKFSPDIAIQSGCAGNHACLNAYLDNPANGWIPGTAVPHPNYDDFAGWPKAATYDVGVIELSRPVAMSTYGVLPTIGLLETLNGNDKNVFTAVGYGLQGYIKPFYSDAWTRYAGTVKLIGTNGSWTGEGLSAKFTNNPGTGGGTCFGDSGGPIFYGDTNIVVSVVSWGHTPCIGVDFNFRTDVPTTQDFVNSFF